MSHGRETILSRVCPLCGRETKVLYGGLCEDCYRKLHPLVKLPESLDVTLCRVCGAYKLGGRWLKPKSREPLREAVEEVVAQAIKTRNRIQDISVVEIEGERARVQVTGSAMEGARAYREEYSVKLHVHWSLCGDCKLSKSKREVARIQVRAKNRDLSAAEAAAAKRVVEQALSTRWRGSLDLLEVIEKPHTLDFVFSSLPSARLAADALKRELPVTVLETRKSTGVDTSGRRAAKVTLRLLLPEFRVGDVIEFRKRLYYVTRLSGEGVWAFDLSRLEEVKLEKGKELIEGSRVVLRREDVEPVVVASLRRGNLEVVTISGEKRSLSLNVERAPSHLREGDQALLVVIEGRYYVLPTPRWELPP
jgi:nonsense-mediated mRNA decay protein 3